MNREVQLTWQGGIEPTLSAGLQYGEKSKQVLTIIRTMIGDVFLTGAPGRLRQIPLPGFVARMTDVNALYYGREPFFDIPTGKHRLQFRIQSGGDSILSREFRLRIPRDTEDNSDFELQ